MASNMGNAKKSRLFILLILPATAVDSADNRGRGYNKCDNWGDLEEIARGRKR